jgi:hypothetical protein
MVSSYSLLQEKMAAKVNHLRLTLLDNIQTQVKESDLRSYENRIVRLDIRLS